MGVVGRPGHVQAEARLCQQLMAGQDQSQDNGLGAALRVSPISSRAHCEQETGHKDGVGLDTVVAGGIQFIPLVIKGVCDDVAMVVVAKANAAKSG